MQSAHSALQHDVTYRDVMVTEMTKEECWLGCCWWTKKVPPTWNDPDRIFMLMLTLACRGAVQCQLFSGPPSGCHQEETQTSTHRYNYRNILYL